MTRKSTPKHEVVSADLSTVILTGVSRTYATEIARAMNKDRPKHRHVMVRPARQRVAA